MTTFLRVLGCYPREMSSLALQSVDLPDPIADGGAAGQHDTLYGSDELLFALASASGRRPDQVRRQRKCVDRASLAGAVPFGADCPSAAATRSGPNHRKQTCGCCHGPQGSP